ncbi:tRNA pseudouridine(38-40) synthase TruA [Flavobacterium sp. Fl-77]|uniref:tRNA pseudouridine synthase A n=1 Tax=Flavobacterium flavipigmentatum TaxID=2893884 RepID=A0AAJ2W1H9_9FLAO|nr:MULTISPECIES: tRNA pseudouridine(38-40) synthase TruA [unclassified Flavobacterium]MDX6182570.1 tRNA pseudouridine(38-40) synthase TruA [Flavobacterium sp. Fl-33]MDX6186250.1 tRNA pseudouridine(38-40) synthase TruA [Flavobacterium sp. Fl-77]UFH38396.1 tRNA pseudouridine(38-40) synthase TruA [Flavobacterium sp. F-70]
MRYFIRFAYNGTHYHGWQFQPNAASVQETLNKALSILLHAPINAMGAGRTDTGVHAQEMYAHFDFETSIDIPNLIHKLNSYLPKDIAIFDIMPVHDEAHCRFDATKRTYEYHINTVKNPFLAELSWYFNRNLDVDLMNQAARILMEHTNFQCFSKVNTDVNTFDCTIFEAYWEIKNDNLVFTISANRFLRNMVRAIVGTLINIGLHKITLTDFENIIISKSREKAGFSVPAHGLYLTKIDYDYIIK